MDNNFQNQSYLKQNHNEKVSVCNVCRRHDGNDCGSGNGNWQEERDSVMNVNEQQRQVLDDLTATLVEVSSSLDSIAVGEGMLRESNEGPVLTKRQMLDNIAAFKETLAANKERLAELERNLAGRNDELAKLSTLVKHLNQELYMKIHYFLLTKILY